jgi:formylglycine-generating enzyme required for sulfatase activity
MKLTLIPAGEFLMGSTDADTDAEDNIFLREKPQHRVRFTRPFYLGVTEVTVGQFRRVVEASGYKTEAESDGKGGEGWNELTEEIEDFGSEYSWRYTGFEQTDEHPVVNVSWNDAVAFCNKLSELEKLKPYYRYGLGATWSGDGYRLPTEAEWEYACRAGTTTRYYNGDDPEALARVGNVADGTLRAKGGELSKMRTIQAQDGYVFTAPVGRFRPNRFGLYDMHGNVFEWCGDGPADYKESPVTDPPGSLMANKGVIRGGSWFTDPRWTRSAFRAMDAPEHRSILRGFRVARFPSGGAPAPVVEEGHAGTSDRGKAPKP